jgi:hypothetical protein
MGQATRGGRLPQARRFQRTFFIVVVQKLLGDRAHFRERAGTMHQKTFLLVSAVIPLDVGILVWPMGRTDVGDHLQTDEKTDQW